jgi:hypothetical protein
MIASVKNPAALVTDVLDDGTLGETTLQTMDERVVGARLSDDAPLRQVRTPLQMHPPKRRRPKPSQVESYRKGKGYYSRPSDQGGQVIRPSVLRAMAELQEMVDREFPQ